MGGLASVLGGVASGFSQAAELDRQRSFELEQHQRAQTESLLDKIIGDDSAHPEARTNAARMKLEIAQTPNGKFNAKKLDVTQLFAPYQPQQTLASQGPAQSPSAQLSIPPLPPGMEGAVPGGGAPSTAALPATPQASAQLIKPSVPAGIFKSPDQLAQEHAAAGGLATQEQLQAQIGVRDTYVKHLQQQGLSPKDVAIQSALAFGHPIPSWTFRAGKTVQMTAGMARQDPELNSLVDPKLDNAATVVAQYGAMGEPQRITQNIVPSLAEKTTASTESMSASGAVSKTSKTTKQLPQLTMPQPQGGANPAIPSITGPSGSKAEGKAEPAPKSTAHVTRSAVDFSKSTDPISMSAVAWATKGIAPKGGTMAERQVLARMKQMGLEPSQPVPPALQQKIQQGFVARNSAIGLIDDIMKNSQVLDSLISAGKIAIGADQDGNGILTRAAALNDREAQVAGDFGQLVEHANLLRGPLGATGFRGQEAWNALQMQRGKIMSDPRITRQLLTGMRERLVGLNNADKMIVEGQGRSGTGGEAQTSGHKVGDTVSVKGQKVKITAIHPDGTFDGDPVK